MNVEKFLKPELVWLGKAFEKPEEVFEAVARKGEELGYVNETFLEKIKERENTFPTGLQLNGYGVAIPHTDAECIEKQFVAIVIPEKSVIFKRMDDANKEVEAEAIFVLGLNEPHSQLAMLQELMKLVQDEKVVKELNQATDETKVVTYLKELSKQKQS